MARIPQNSQEIERLIRLSAASRARLSHDAANLRRSLDVPGRVRLSLARHPLKWLGGGLAAGLAATLVLRRKAPAPPNKRRGLRATVFALAFAAAQPIIKAWLGRQLKDFLASKFQSSIASRPPSGNSPLPKF